MATNTRCYYRDKNKTLASDQMIDLIFTFRKYDNFCLNGEAFDY